MANTIVDVRVASSTDDAEENTATGSMSRSSSDLEMSTDGSKNQLIGVRFTGLDIPPGAVIVSAYLQFTVDEVSTGAAALTIGGQDSDDALTFSSSSGDISSRATTDETVDWNPADWNTVGESGDDQQTPDISAIVQEIIDRGGWTADSALALTISGTGKRTAESFNGSAASAPLLHIEYAVPDTGIPAVDLDGDDSSGATGADFAASFVALGAAAAIANTDTLITDSNSTMLESATITITNPETDDVLAFGAMPGGITATLAPDGFSLVLSGTASLADYETAIETVTFESTSATPVTGDRTIDVVVNDGTTDSAAAATTVTVFASNAAPVAGDDSYYAVDGVAKLFDAAELTGNDSDADGDPLTVTGVTVPGNGTAVLEPDGSVTYTAAQGFSGIDTFDYTVSDGKGGVDVATVTVNVIDSGDVQTVESRIATSTDDAEEKLNVNSVSTSSSDLELPVDGSKDQIVGLRFTGLNIPTDAIILNAYIQFTVDEASAGAVALTIGGEDTDDAQTFSTATGNISSRADTDATVDWTPADWTTVGEAGLDQRTPDISAVIQEIVDRSGWTAASALALTLSGSGKRTAESYNGSKTKAPLLHIEYALPGDGVPEVDLDGDDSSGAAAGDFAAIFIVQGAAIAIADADTFVTDSDGTTMETATITITNPETDDALGFDVGEIPGSITAIVAPDGYSVSLSGTASLADYQTAIEAITFENTSGAPVIGDRAIEVIVDDGTTPSAPATATISVLYPNTAPVAAGDAIFAVDGVAKQIAAADLIGNDVDPDGDPLTIIAITDPANGTAVLNPDGSVTYTTDPGHSGADSFDYTISDGRGGTDTATVDIDVVGLLPSETIEARVASSSDDAEENLASSSVSITSSDLELSFDGSKDQLIGMRFTGLAIPIDAVIVNAYIQFTADEVSTGAAALVISGEDADDAQTYSTAAGDLSSRASTDASVAWNPNDWNTVGDSGTDQQTSDISSVIQEIIDRAGWNSGDAIALTIAGSGDRTAESYNGVSASAPLLHIEYAMPADGIPRIDLDGDDSSGATDSDFETTLPYGGGPVAIADSDALVTDSDSLTLESATIIITNPETGDALAFGALPGGITATLAPDGYSLVLSGTASLADYQDAIEDVTFDNPLVDPTIGARTIEVTLDDGATVGPAATTDLTVIGPGFEFMVIADSPYSNGDFDDLEDELSNIPADTQFVIHLGDIKSGSSSVDPETYFPDVADTLQTSTVPLFIILGDNEYNDMPDPDEALTEWKDNFLYFDQNWTHSLGVEYQDVRQENFSFVFDDTLFIGLNMVGSSVHDADEWATRNADNLAWIEEKFGQHGASASNAVLFGHASPKHSGYDVFETGFLTVAQDFDKPILYLQGDTHNWDLDNPWSEAPNIVKVVVDMTNGVNAPLQVSVDNDPNDPFASDHDFGGLFL